MRYYALYALWCFGVDGAAPVFKPVLHYHEYQDSGSGYMPFFVIFIPRDFSSTARRAVLGYTVGRLDFYKDPR